MAKAIASDADTQLGPGSPTPNSRATSAIVRPVSVTSRAASLRYFGVYDFLFAPMDAILVCRANPTIRMSTKRGQPHDTTGHTNPTGTTVSANTRDTGTPCSQPLTEDTTWTPDYRDVYLIDCQLTIPQGVTLTIEPGTILKFTGSYAGLPNGPQRAPLPDLVQAGE